MWELQRHRHSWVAPSILASLAGGTENTAEAVAQLRNWYVDQRLRDVPGATMTPGGWWQNELRGLRAVMGDALCPEGVS